MVSRLDRIGWPMVGIAFWFGLGLLALAFATSLAVAAAVLVLIAAASRWFNVSGISWLQRRTDPAFEGRVMSLVMLASMGLAPIAYAVSGALVEVGAGVLFAAGGLLVIATGAASTLSRTVRAM